MRPFGQIVLGALDAVAPALAGRYVLQSFTTPRRARRPRWEEELAQTARRLDLPNGVVARTWGEDGRAVLLVHGWEGRGTQLGAFVEPLRAHGFRVVAIDAPAHGDSRGRRANPVAYGRLLHTASSELGGVHAAIAHSVGAMALAWALNAGMRPARVVLVAPVCSYFRGTERVAKGLRLSARATQVFQSRLEHRIGVPLASVDVAHLARGFDLPALFMHDPVDAEIPFAISELISRSWRHSRLVPVPGAGHRGILRAEAAIAEATRFIAAVPENAIAPSNGPIGKSQ